MLLSFTQLHPDSVIPTFATSGSAGFDLTATETVFFLPGDTEKVPTGLAFEIPPGWQLEIRPRSGMSLKTKLRIANSPGTVDSDFRGEVCVIMDNIGLEMQTVRKGDRIAQAVLTRVEQPTLLAVPSLSHTERGSNGFGSSGA